MLCRDAGLVVPRPFTISGNLGSERVWALTSTIDWELGQACQKAMWTRNIDIEVHNQRPDGRDGYVNILVDWNRDGVPELLLGAEDGRFYHKKR